MSASAWILLGVGVASAEPFEFGRVTLVEADQRAAESGHDAGEDGADLPRADHPHRPTHEIETHETVELEIPLARAIVGARNLAIQREEEADGKLGHGVGKIIDNAHDLDAELPRRPHVDMVEACGTRRDELGTAGGEVFSTSAVTESLTMTLTAGKPAARDAVPGPRSVSK